MYERMNAADQSHRLCDWPQTAADEYMLGLHRAQAMFTPRKLLLERKLPSRGADTLLKQPESCSFTGWKLRRLQPRPLPVALAIGL